MRIQVAETGQVSDSAGIAHVSADGTAEALGRNRAGLDLGIRDCLVGHAIAQRKDLQLAGSLRLDVDRRADQHSVGYARQAAQPAHGAAPLAYGRHTLSRSVPTEAVSPMPVMTTGSKCGRLRDT